MQEMHKKILGSGTTTLIISNDKIEDVIKIVKSLDNPGLLLKRLSEGIQNKAKNKTEDFTACC